MKTLAILIQEIDDVENLIRFGALLAKDTRMNVHVLHVQFPQVYGTANYMGGSGAMVARYPSQLQNIAKEVEKNVDGFIQEIRAEHPGIPLIESKSEIGDASAILKEKVDNKTYDIVMLQSNTEQNFWMQNSAIMEVVRNVPCPVYIIPPDARYNPLEKIIYATDYSEEDIPTLKSLIELAKPFDPEILALHISDDDEFDKKLKSEGFARMLGEKTGYNKVSVMMITEADGKDPVESLVKEAEKAKANLIVVLKENENFFERLFKSSFTAELINSTQLPVLVFHKAG